MDKQFFTFCHYIYKRDRVLATWDVDFVMKIVTAAAVEFARVSLTHPDVAPKQWVEKYYDEWLDKYLLFVSPTMPKRCQKIITGEK